MCKGVLLAEETLHTEGQSNAIISGAAIVTWMPELTKHVLTACQPNSDPYIAPFLETIKYHSGSFQKFEYLDRDLPLNIVIKKRTQRENTMSLLLLSEIETHQSLLIYCFFPPRAKLESGGAGGKAPITQL